MIHLYRKGKAIETESSSAVAGAEGGDSQQKRELSEMMVIS